MRRLLPRLILLLLVLLLAGCGNRVQVEIPPKAPVEGIGTIAIAPFDNVTADAGLAFEFEEQIAKALRDSGWYESIINLRHTASFPPGRPVTFESVRDLARQYGADAVIVGVATYYFEDVYMGVPQCSGCDRPETNPSWSVTQYTNVAVQLSARLIAVSSGNELHGMQVRGEDVDYRTHFLSHRGYTPPPEALIPKPNRQRVPDTRSFAIRQAVYQFTRDLLPTYEWRSID